MKYLEYIQSSGTQYIDTKIACNLIKILKIKFAIVFASSSASILYGSYDNNLSANVRASNYLQYYSNRIYIYSCNAVKDFNPSILPVLNKIYNLECPINSAGVAYLRDENNIQIATTNVLKNSETLTMTLFGRNTISLTVSHLAHAKIYSCKLYNANNELISDFVPLENDNNEVGLYDEINDKFYGNLGTGSFVAGPEIRQYKFYSKKALDDKLQLKNKIINLGSSTIGILNTEDLKKINTNPEAYLLKSTVSGETIYKYTYTTETTKEYISIFRDPTLDIWHMKHVIINSGNGHFSILDNQITEEVIDLGTATSGTFTEERLLKIKNMPESIIFLWNKNNILTLYYAGSSYRFFYSCVRRDPLNTYDHWYLKSLLINMLNGDWIINEREI